MRGKEMRGKTIMEWKEYEEANAKAKGQMHHQDDLGSK